MTTPRKIPVFDSKLMPLPPLPEMTLPAPAVVPPTVVFVPPMFPLRMPSPRLP
jgi:hypothetical protein